MFGKETKVPRLSKENSFFIIRSLVPYLAIYKSLGYKRIGIITLCRSKKYDSMGYFEKREKERKKKKKKTEVLSGKSSSTDNGRLSEA